MKPGRSLRALLLLACILAWGVAQAEPGSAAKLRAAFAAARQAAGTTTFDRPLYLQSTEASDRLQGDVYAVIERPFGVVKPALTRPEQWCTVLILHLNTKYCRVTKKAGRDVLDVGVGRRFDQPLSDVYWVSFDHAVMASQNDYLQVVMLAPTGPMSTSDYRIAVETAPLDEGHTLVHLTYAYSVGFAGRLAMNTYLATLGSDKVGFSVVGKGDDGKPLYVGGVRGVIERNTMRYYLAIESYLGALSLPTDAQMAASLAAWWDATERYARQLHEIDRSEYLEMKRHEISRQATTPPPNH